MKNRILLIFCILLTNLSSKGQSTGIHEVFPPHWWQGMASNELQLLCHGESIGNWTLHRLPAGFKLKRLKTFPNKNYLSLDLELLPGLKRATHLFIFKDAGGKERLLTYDIKKREARKLSYGLKGNDFIYLLMPDRFANAQPKNDRFPDMAEQDADRTNMWKRHGGDLAGMQAQLAYLEDLGVTAVWPTPVWKNDQPQWSYHGYAVTDHYKTDPRLGTNQDYKNFVQASHDLKIRVVFDIVFNHLGDQHLLYRDIPDSSWFNVPDTKRRTNFNTVAIRDPYASAEEKKWVTRGWFDGHMPDLNQDNPELASFLIQNSLWWVEEFALDAFRVDTYPYVEQAFLSDWMRVLHQEYPGFTVFAEVWAKGLVTLGSYGGNSALRENQNSRLTGLLDFEWYWAVADLLHGGDNAAERLYLTLSQDMVYGKPDGNVIFLGNHDLTRIFSLAGQDERKFRMAAVLLLTQRGIPHWFYGDEFLFDAYAEPLDRVRPDFPLGWADSDTSLLKPEARAAHIFVRQLARWRKHQPVFENGKYMHFPPANGIYVYFRYTADQAVMVIVNTTDQQKSLVPKKYTASFPQFESAKAINGGDPIGLQETWQVPAMSATVLELQP